MPTPAAELSCQLTPQHALSLSPALVAFVQLLALPWPDLEIAVEKEMASNPALVRQERRGCWTCGGNGRPPRSCRLCARGAPTSRAGAAVGDGPDRSRPDRLVDEVMTVLADRDRSLAAWVVANLDERGLLPVGPAELAEDAGVALADVDRVVTALRAVGPVGIAAADVRECLLLQLDHLAERGRTHPLATPIVRDHLDDLAVGRTSAVARALHASVDEVIAARDFISRRLRPYPTADDGGDDPRAYVPPPVAVPDVAVLERPGETGRYDVEVLERRRLGLTVDSTYRHLASANDAPAGVAEHVRDHTRRARRFLSRLEQRWQTMELVAEHVVSVQAGFFDHGPAALQPLTRAAVAEATCLHESTVSRATAGRWLLAPSGRLVPYTQLLTPALAVQDALRQVVAEGGARSDNELAAELARRGFRVARRTVAKYRASLAIPAQSRR